MTGVTWDAILREYARSLEVERPVHPTIHVGPNVYTAAMEAGFRPEDFTLVPRGVRTFDTWLPTLGGGTVRPQAGGQ